MAAKAFTELANGKIGNKRDAVVSKLNDGSYTIGQRIEVADEGKIIKVFLKGALHASNLEGLQTLRDIINEAIEKEQK